MNRALGLRLNSLLLALIALLVVAVAGVALLVLIEAWSPAAGAPWLWLEIALQDLDALRGGDKGLAIAITGVVALCGGALALASVYLVLPSRTPPPFPVTNGPEGQTTVSRRSVERYVAGTAERTTGVTAAAVRVRPNPEGKLLVNAMLTLAPDSSLDVPATVAGARTAIVDSIERQIGLSVSDVRIDTTIAYPGRRRRRSSDDA